MRGHLTKNRNGPVSLQLAFGIDVLDVGEDSDGDPIRLPLAVETVSENAARPKLTRSERAALNELLDMVRLSDGPVLTSRWQAACEQTRVVSDADKLASRTKAFSRAMRELQRKGMICIDVSRAWPSSMPERAPDFEPFECVAENEDAL